MFQWWQALVCSGSTVAPSAQSLWPLLFPSWPGGSSGLQQALRAPGVQVQPDSQSQPRQAAAAGSLCYPGSKCFKVNKRYDRPFPSSPLTQGAFTACSRVSELAVFPQAAEVKVDPDKPLEGARLAVLQVPLWRKTTDPVAQHIVSYFQLSTVNSTRLVYLTIPVLHFHRREKLYWSQLLAFALDFSIRLFLPKVPTNNSSTFVPLLRCQFRSFRFAHKWKYYNRTYYLLDVSQILSGCETFQRSDWIGCSVEGGPGGGRFCGGVRER